MFRNYFKTGWRNLLKNKGYSFINIGGLTVGMAVAMLIGLWILDEISFNKYHENYPFIAQVMRQEKDYANSIQPTGLGTLLKTKYGNHFKHVVLIRGRLEERAIATDDKNFLQGGYFMQPDGPEMFSLKMVYGLRDGLKDMKSILLSESLAKKLFGEENPVGLAVKMDNKWDLKVTGVYEDLPENTQFKDASYFAPLALYLNGWSSLDVWDNFNMYLFVQINPQDDFHEISRVIKNAMPGHSDGPDESVFLHAWSNWQTDYRNGGQVSSMRYTYILMIGSIGIFILVLACINFMNLTTARSEKRAKEVGVRKTIGSGRGQLIGQFLSESLIFAMLSFLMALMLVFVFLPLFNEIAGKKIALPWNNPAFWLSGIAFTLFTALLSVSYPAFYLSSFSPLKVFKGTFRMGGNAAVLRKVLVVVQFTVSISLIVGTIIVYQQAQLAKNRPVGYSPNGLLTLPIRSPEIYGQFDALRNELKKTGAVQEIAQSNYPITSDKGWNVYFDWPGKDPSYNPSFNTMEVTPEYGRTIGLDFVEGRDFSREIPTDKEGIIINESALKIMGLKDPVGETVSWAPPGSNTPRSYVIVGVAKDMIKGSPYEPAFPTIMFYRPNNLEELFIRLNPNISASEALPKIQQVFHNLVPSVPFDYKFVDEEYNKKFATEKRIEKLSGLFTIVAILISCMGLFGLASFVAEQRTKEIGIRKILGAPTATLWRMLTKDFVWLVLLSILASTPLAYYFLHKWLQNYEYRTDISWWVFALAGVGALLVTISTVSFQTLKAALMDPVKSLRSE